MFWKKKKPVCEPAVDLETQDQREAFRYVFKVHNRIPLVFRGTPVEVIDISAGGMAFKNAGFKQYDADRVTLDLKIPNFPGTSRFTATLRILNITKNNVCNCIFEDCTIQTYELIHKYVLEMQKQDLTSGAE